MRISHLDTAGQRPFSQPSSRRDNGNDKSIHRQGVSRWTRYSSGTAGEQSNGPAFDLNTYLRTKSVAALLWKHNCNIPPRIEHNLLKTCLAARACASPL